MKTYEVTIYENNHGEPYTYLIDAKNPSDASDIIEHHVIKVFINFEIKDISVVEADFSEPYFVS